MKLHRIYSDLRSFKDIIFHDGLNIILAEKSEESSDGKTRNGAGKSCAVEIINTLLGGEIKKSSILKNELFSDKYFGIELSHDSKRFTVERKGDAPNKIKFGGEFGEVINAYIEDDGRYASNDEWRKTLGKLMFGLSPESLSIKHAPSFRSLFSYFARSGGGFDEPTKWFPQQSACSSQVAITYLLKLNWKIAGGFEGARQKEKLIKALTKAANEGVLGQIMGASSDLKTEIHLKNRNVERLRTSLTSFRVLPEYQEKEARTSEISKRLAELSAQDTYDKEWLGQLERAVAEELEPDFSRLERLFGEAVVELPDLVKKRFDEVEEFHRSVITNRREHLKQEMAETYTRIGARLREKGELDNERSEILSLLQSHGALEQFMKLQGMLSRQEADLELLKKKLDATENLEDKKTEIKIQRQQLLTEMRIDHAERDAAIRDAIVTFADISGELYEEHGKLVIDPTENGPKFDFEIHAKKSVGINKMQIFSFDMTLMKLWSREKYRPTILVHDSQLFDGVDERQIAKALRLGAKMAKNYGFQYVVTMNSDDLPDMSTYDDFVLNDYRVELNIDDSENGGLFGVRF
ncbi:ABC-three component system protein [Sedimenticola hydrogenitrophicus]|uniref:ABC-three component system protein n=1 Tax=Sedimenticola hydrogenitrophicus TaxID=2967975 RepID=UPI0023B11EF0|nr:ABC-three component system protein [Sedimenticola hydrogenitrophicus]